MISFSVMLILVATGFMQAPVKRSLQPNDDVRCGIYCLTVAGSAVGNRDIMLAQVETILGEPGVKGYSLLQLDEAAEKLGFKTIAVRTSLENLSFRRRSIGERFACIASFGTDHFVIIYGSDGKVVRIADPPRKYHLEIPVFEKEWTGNCLLIGTETLSTEESVISRQRNRAILRRIGMSGLVFLLVAIVCGAIFRLRNSARKSLAVLTITCGISLVTSGCAERGKESDPKLALSNDEISQTVGGLIEIVPSRHSLGVVRGGSDQTIPIVSEIRNSGNEILKIGRVTVSCGCTQASIDQPVLWPGEIAKLTANVKIGESQDSRSAHIRIESSDRKRPFVELEINWIADLPLKTEPLSLVRHNISTEAGNEFDIAVLSKFVSLCDKCEIRTKVPSDSLILDWSPDAQVKRVGHSWKPDDFSEMKLGILKVKLLPIDVDLHHQEEIQFELACGDETRARTTLPLNWTFRRWFSVAPSRVFFGTVKSGEVITKSVVVRSLSDGNLHIRSVRLENEGLKFETRIDRISGDESRIHLTITAPPKKGPWTDEIVIETDSKEQSVIRLPVSSLVE